MITYVYVLQSIQKTYIYVGLTHNVQERYKRHQNGREKTTRSYKPFNIILIEEYATRQEARIREKYLKSGCGKEWIKTTFAGVVKLADLPAGRQARMVTNYDHIRLCITKYSENLYICRINT